MGADPVNAPIPASLALLVYRVRSAIDELRAAQARVVSLKRVPPETTGDQEDAMLERERAIAAMNALEFEIAPALAELDLQATVNAIYASGRWIPPDRLTIEGTIHGPATRQVVAMQPSSTFRILELRFANPELWFVHRVQIGWRDQRITGPATLFHGMLVNDLDTLQTGMDLSFDVEYRGDDTRRPVSFHALALGISSDREVSEEHMQRILANIQPHGEPAQPYMPGPQTADEMAQRLIDVAESTRRSAELIDRDRAMLGTPQIAMTTVEAQALVDALRTVMPIMPNAELELEAEIADHEQQILDDLSPPSPPESTP